MDLVILVLGIALAGFMVWMIITYVPMPPIFKTIIVVAVAVFLILFLARQFSGSVPNVMH